MPGVILDGVDVLGCYRLAKEAIDRARAGEGPTLLEAKVSRMTAHSSDDQQTKYRSAEELKEQGSRDPLPRFRQELRDAGVLDDEAEERIKADDQGRGGGRDRLLRARSPTRIPPRPSGTSTPSRRRPGWTTRSGAPPASWVTAAR